MKHQQSIFGSYVMRLTWQAVGSWACVLACLLGTVQAQEPKVSSSLATTPYLKSTPSRYRHLVDAYGDRLQKPGNERITMTGTYVDQKGTSSGVLVAEIPGKVRLTLKGGVSKDVLFDGQQPNAPGASLGDDDLDLLESFQGDTPENFLYSIGGAATIRLVGSGFRPDDGAKVYSGPRYDIYEVLSAVPAKKQTAYQQKLFYFDSATGVFVKSRYKIQRNGIDVEVQTLYSNYTKVNGQNVPGRIERREDGKTVFTFTVSATQFSALQNDSVFSGK